MAQSDANEKTAAPAKKSPVLLIVLLVNLLAGGGAVAYVLTRPSTATAEGGGGPAAMTMDPTDFVVKDMPAFILNLSDDDGNRYLKLTLTVRLRNELARERFITLEPAVRDRFIQHITSLRMSDLATPEQKKDLKRDLTEQANEVTIRGDVVDVYFTEFVIQ